MSDETPRFSLSFPQEDGSPMMRIECNDFAMLVAFVKDLELEVTEDVETR